MIEHGVLTRDGFRPAVAPVTPGEEDIAPQRAKSSELARLRVLGETMTGQVVEYETYDSILLHQPLPADIVDFWTRTIVWYQIVGGEVLRKKLADRREQMQNRKSHLLRLAPTGAHCVLAVILRYLYSVRRSFLHLLIVRLCRARAQAGG